MSDSPTPPPHPPFDMAKAMSNFAMITEFFANPPKTLSVDKLKATFSAAIELDIMRSDYMRAFRQLDGGQTMTNILKKPTTETPSGIPNPLIILSLLSLDRVWTLFKQHLHAGLNATASELYQHGGEARAWIEAQRDEQDKDIAANPEAYAPGASARSASSAEGLKSLGSMQLPDGSMVTAMSIPLGDLLGLLGGPGAAQLMSMPGDPDTIPTHFRSPPPPASDNDNPAPAGSGVD